MSRLTAESIVTAIANEIEDSEYTDSDESASGDVEHIEDIYNEQIFNASHSNSSESDEEAPISLRMRSTNGGRNRQVTPSGSAPHIQRRHLVDKNGASWSYYPPVQRRRAMENAVRQRGGPTKHSRDKTPGEIWNLFFTEDMLLKIVEYLQRKLYSLAMDDAPTLSIDSLKCFIGVMYFRGANNDTSIPITNLCSEDAPDFCRGSMSRTLFQLWNRILRFDDQSARETYIPSDTFVVFREIFTLVNGQFRKLLIPSACLTVDEQLVYSKSRSPHRVYNPMKPGKCGELVRWICDNDLH